MKIQLLRNTTNGKNEHTEMKYENYAFLIENSVNA